MKVSFTGNHLYRCADINAAIGLVQSYKAYKAEQKKPMIIYGDNDDGYYVHVIDGKDAVNFRRACQMNRKLVDESYLFKALTNAYKEKATVVDFTNAPHFEFDA